MGHKFSWYSRFCSRCGVIFRTNARYAKVCDACLKPKGKRLNLKNKVMRCIETGKKEQLGVSDS